MGVCYVLLSGWERGENANIALFLFDGGSPFGLLQQRRKAELLLCCGNKLNPAPPRVLFLLLLRAFVSCNTALGKAYLGTQGFRVMNPHPLASGSHCSNVRTLCSRPPPSKFEECVHSYGAKAINSHPAPVWNWRSGWTDVHFSPLGRKISQMQDKYKNIFVYCWLGPNSQELKGKLYCTYVSQKNGAKKMVQKKVQRTKII